MWVVGCNVENLVAILNDGDNANFYGFLAFADRMSQKVSGFSSISIGIV